LAKTKTLIIVGSVAVAAAVASLMIAYFYAKSLGTTEAVRPKANNDLINMPRGESEVTVDVLANDYNIANNTSSGNDKITILRVSMPSHGIAEVTKDDKVSYKSFEGFVGTDYFTYSITNPEGVTDGASVTVMISP
jgi:hypothetical protein